MVKKDYRISPSELNEIFELTVDGDLIWKINNKIAGTVAKNGYRAVMLRRKIYMAHRIVWALVYGEWPDSEIDHINRNKLDNRINNLRIATREQNNWNVGKRKNNTSGFVGVFFHKKSGRWYSTIRFSGKRKNLGYFDTIEEAAQARRNAEQKYHGCFAHGACR